MRQPRRLLGVGSLTAVVAAAVLASPAQAAASPAPVQDFLAGQLGTLAAATPTTVLVHGADIAAARAAVATTPTTFGSPVSLRPPRPFHEEHQAQAA